MGTRRHRRTGPGSLADNSRETGHPPGERGANLAGKLPSASPRPCRKALSSGTSSEKPVGSVGFRAKIPLPVQLDRLHRHLETAAGVGIGKILKNFKL